MELKSKLKTIFPYLAIISVMLLSRIFELDSFVATDEVAWFNRSANFYYALGQREFADTYRNVSVAVFTMWINTFAFLLKFPMYRGLGQGYLGLYDKEWAPIFVENNVSELYVLTTGRFLMVIALIILGVFIFWYLKRLLGTIPALISFLIISLDPFYIALSRTSHLDAPMGTFLLLSILAYHTYHNSERKWIDLTISGGAGALSFLSKLPGMLVIPGVIGVSAITLISSYGKKTFQLSKKIWAQLFFHFKTFGIWLLIFFLVIMIIWPVMWVEPLQTMEKVFFGPMSFVDTEVESEVDIYETTTLKETKPSVISYIRGKTIKTLTHFNSYIKSFYWRTSPIVLLGLLWLLFGYLFKWDLLEKDSVRSLVRTLVFVAFYFTILISVPDKRGEKYIIPGYLALDIISGIGWVAAIGLLSKKFKTKYQKVLTYALLFLVVVIQSIGVWDNYPYYFSYYNPILGGSKIAGEVRFVGVGEGLDQAAKFLNQMPDAENLRVYSWYGKGPFSYFFKGKTAIIPTGIIWSEDFIYKLRSSDYLVVYSNQWHRQTPPELFDILEGVEPFHRVWIEEIEYVRTYKVEDIPLDGITE
jgi:hypothetical protein